MLSACHRVSLVSSTFSVRVARRGSDGMQAPSRGMLRRPIDRAAGKHDNENTEKYEPRPDPVTSGELAAGSSGACAAETARAEEWCRAKQAGETAVGDREMGGD